MTTPYEVDEEAAAVGIGKLLEALRGGLTADPFNQPGTGTSPTGEVTTPEQQHPVAPAMGDLPVSQPFGGEHGGVDISVPVGTPMLAAIAGTVTHAGDDDPGGYGSWVEITGADGTVIRYGHLASIRVATGQAVKPGELIGASGGAAGAPGAGNSTGPHLHFEVRVNGTGVDPMAYLAGGWQIAGQGAVPGGNTTGPAAPPPTPEAATAEGLSRLTAGLMGGAPESSLQRPAAQTGTSTGPGPEGIDAFLAATRQHESGGNYTIYNQSGLSDASGAYQYISSTWNNYKGYRNAADAPPEVQDEKARADATALFAKYGDWRLVAIAWYGGPGIADQVAKGINPGSPAGQGPYLAYGDKIVSMMGGYGG